MSREKIFHLRALGAQVQLTRSDVNKGHPAYYQDYARRLADETPGAFYIDQFNNEAESAGACHHHCPGNLPAAGRRYRRDRRRRRPGKERSAGYRPGLLNTPLKRNLSSPIRRAPFWRTRSKPGATVKPAPGWLKGSAKTLFRRWPILKASAALTASPIAKLSPPPASCCRLKVFWQAPLPEHCSPPPCATAGRRHPLNAW